MNNHVKNQHYVPQFLLKNFSSRGGKFIWAYDNNEKHNIQNQIKERAIKRVASEEYFYDQFENSRIGSYEYELQQAEDDSAPIIKKVITTKDIEGITQKERKILSSFIILQNLRTKKQLLQTYALMNTVSEQLEGKWNIKMPKTDHKKIWFSVLEQSANFHEILFNKVWTLCESNNDFLISDNPVTLQNTVNRSEIRGTLGLDSYGIEIYLPLSPSLTLCLFCGELFSSMGYNKQYIPNIKYNSKHTVYLNSLQTAYSERFIFSHKKEQLEKIL